VISPVPVAAFPYDDLVATSKRRSRAEMEYELLEPHRNRTLLSGWSSRWRWQRRLEAYLQHQEEERLRQIERDIRECNQRHQGIAEVLRSKAIERLQQLDTSRLPIDSAIKMFALAIQTERQAYGLDKPPVALRSKTTVTETSLSETGACQRL
jgi:hypothetical protein